MALLWTSEKNRPEGLRYILPRNACYSENRFRNDKYPDSRVN